MIRPSLNFGLARGLFRICAIAATAIAATGAVLPAWADPRLAGHWEGAIELPGVKLGIDVDFAESGGALSGDISIPLQQVKDLALRDIAVAGDAVGFTLPGVPGDPKFEGALAADGTAIAGNFLQGGASFPFELKKDAAAAPVAAPVAAPAPPAAGATPEKLAGLDALLEKAVADWQVPGMGVAVVKGGEVVYARGFGFRDLENKKPMTADTLFAIGSSSKAMTATLLGMLVDQGKMEWDEPVVRYLPEFRLADATVTARVTPRDLMSHRSGLPRHELVWYNNLHSSREELIGRMAHLELSADLREKWQYSNLGVLTAGYLAGKLEGKAWEAALRERLTQPLGMQRTVFTLAEMERDADHALPYLRKDGALVRIPFRNIDTIGPAGAVDSSVNEMASWLLFNLNGGKTGEKRLIEASTLADIHSPQMALPAPAPEMKIAQQAYGLGWFVEVYRGHRTIEHGGAIDGFQTALTFFPDDGIGIVAFTNRNSPLPDLAAREIADRLLGLEKIEWMADALTRLQAAEAAQKAQQAAEQAQQQKAKKSAAPTTGKPAHPMADYAGVYENPGYGRLEVRSAPGDTLAIRFDDLDVPLRHVNYEVWVGAAKEGGEAIFQMARLFFRTDFEGAINAVEATLEPMASPIVFKKQQDPRFSDPAFLERYRGEYRGASQVARIEVAGTKLTVKVDNQPLLTLVPEAAGRFGIEGLPGFSVTFEEEGGQVHKIVFHQPNGVFSLERATF